MVSKNAKIIIGVIFALFLLFGCLGSGSENNQVKTVKTAEVAAQHAQVTQVNPDVEWLRTTGNWMIVIGQDMESVSSAATSRDLDGLYRYAKQVKGNIENAKKSDSEYSPSSKYAYAHSEYLNSLEDIGNAMDLIISCGDGGWTDSQKITEATELMEKGNVHIKNFSDAIKNA